MNGIVLSPVPEGEYELMEQREKAASEAFAAAWQRPVNLSARIYYHPRLALTEELHVLRSRRGPLYDAHAGLERRVRTIIGLTDQRLYDEVTEAIRNRQFGKALERSRVLAKVDDSGKSIGNLIELHCTHLKGIPEGEVLLEFLVDHLPVSASLHNIAATLHRASHMLAERVYERALERFPTDANILGNFATFLSSIYRDFGQVEAAYRKALDADPNHATNLGNFALFFQKVRKDFDAAETYFRKALDADPDNANCLGNFANFLERVRKDFDAAETYYRKALDADPGDANHLGNFARLLLVQNRWDEGCEYLERAFAAAPNQKMVLCELHFYAYAHGKGRWPNALSLLKELLTSGARSPGWDLQANVQRARDSGHPEPELLAALADVLADAAPLATLEAFQAWHQAT